MDLDAPETLNGKRDDFTREDFCACAATAGMKRGRAESIVEEVRSAVSRWPEYAEGAGVPVEWRDRIARTLRLEGFR